MARKPRTGGLMGRSIYAPLDLEADVEEVAPVADNDEQRLMLSELSASRSDHFRTVEIGANKKKRDLTEADLKRLEAQRRCNDKTGRFAKLFSQNKERMGTWDSFAQDNKQLALDEGDFEDVDDSGQFHRVRLNAEVAGRNHVPQNLPLVKQKGSGGPGTRRYLVHELLEAQQKRQSQLKQAPAKPAQNLPLSKAAGNKAVVVPQPIKASTSTTGRTKPKKAVRLEEPGALPESRGHINFASSPVVPPGQVSERSRSADSQKHGLKPPRPQPLPRPPRPNQPDTWSEDLANLNQTAWMEHHAARFRQRNLQQANKGEETPPGDAKSIIQAVQPTVNATAQSVASQQTPSRREVAFTESEDEELLGDPAQYGEVIAQLREELRASDEVPAYVSSTAPMGTEPALPIVEESASPEQGVLEPLAKEDIVDAEDNLIDVGDTAALSSAIPDIEKLANVHQASPLPPPMPSPGMKDLQTVNEGPVLLVLNLDLWRELWKLFANHVEKIDLVSMSKLGSRTFFTVGFSTSQAATEASQVAPTLIRDLSEAQAPTQAQDDSVASDDLAKVLRYDGREVGMPLEEASGPWSEPMIVHGQRTLLIRGYSLDEAQFMFFPHADYIDTAPGCSEESRILLATFSDHRDAVDAIIDARKEGFGKDVSWFAATPEYLKVSPRFRQNHEHQGRGKSKTLPDRVRALAVCEIPKVFVGVQPRRRIRLSSPPRERTSQTTATVVMQDEQVPAPNQKSREVPEPVADEDINTKHSVPNPPRPSAEDTLSLALSNDPTNDSTGWNSFKSNQAAPSEEARPVEKRIASSRPAIKISFPPRVSAQGSTQTTASGRKASGLGGSRFVTPQQTPAPSCPHAVGLGGSRYATTIPTEVRFPELRPVSIRAPNPTDDDVDYGAQMRRAFIHRTPKPYERLPSQHHGRK